MARKSGRIRQKSAAYFPSALVLDCSVTLAWYLEGESTEFTDQLLQLTPTLEIWVPSLWTLEFTNALFAAQRRRRLDVSEREQIVAQASRLPINVDSHVISLREADGISAQHDLTPYDAAYFELARRRKLPLATLDSALVHAARAATLPVITDNTLFPDK